MSASIVSADSSLLETLDKCAAMYIECYRQLLSERSLLEKCLDDGFLNLSKARSIMGCASLSIMQVPNELECSVRVEVKQEELRSKVDESGAEFKIQLDKFQLVNSANEENRDEKSSEESNAPKPAASSPLWFGALTPQSLKASHKSFARSLHLIASICELQNKLETLAKKYRDLLKQKSQR